MSRSVESKSKAGFVLEKPSAFCKDQLMEEAESNQNGEMIQRENNMYILSSKQRLFAV